LFPWALGVYFVGGWQYLLGYAVVAMSVNLIALVALTAQRLLPEPAPTSQTA
jgi:hypothetical protein